MSVPHPRPAAGPAIADSTKQVRDPDRIADDREWWRWHFAGQALVSFPEGTDEESLTEAARVAVTYAGALIAELEKKRS